VAAGGGVLRVDRPGERTQAEERLRALELRGALVGGELADDFGVIDPRRVAPPALAPVERAVGEAQQLLAATSAASRSWKAR